MLGTCMYCDQKRMVDDEEVKEFAKIHAIPVESAADSIAARQCNCDGACLARQKEETIELATKYMNNIFEDHPRVLEMSLKAIDAVANMVVDKVTFKKGKKTYTLYLDKLGCLKLKKSFTDRDEVKF